jgi:hypothetical protein
MRVVVFFTGVCQQVMSVLKTKMNMKNNLKLFSLNSCLDANECVESPGICHQNASCTNTDGNYFCACLTGFTGDGYLNCSGEFKRKLRLKEIQPENAENRIYHTSCAL